MTVDLKKILILNLPYLLFVYLFDKLCQAVRLAPGLDASEKFLHLSQGFTEAFSSGLPSLHLLDLLVGIAGAVIVRLAVYAKGKNARKYRKGIEYGSARWGTAADIAPYVDPVPDWNIPLTQTEKLTMSSRPKNPKYARNKNILVIGGSGSGKTRFFVKPSLMQMHSSYVVTDPKGQLLSEVGTMLRRGAPKLNENGKPMRDAHGKVIYEPYRIKVLNTINFKKSMKYNPFAYNVIICDPEDEYSPLVKRLGGQVIRLSPSSTDYVNPLDINLNYSEEENPLALKSDFVLSFCELIMGSKMGLEAIEKTVIDRAVQMIYQPYFADPRPENMPILGDLMNALLSQHIPEADRVAQALDLYVNGSLNFFNHRTTVDISNRLVCFDIKGLGKNLKKPGMLIVQDAVWNTVTINRAIGRSTWYFVDEFHLLLKEEQTAAYSAEIWKRFRKWGGIPTGATQNPKDLLSSPEIENILENSDFIYMLNQAAGDRKILAERLNISSEQLAYDDFQ